MLDGQCSVISVPHEEQIVVQAGDVVGFFFSRLRVFRDLPSLSSTSINNTGLQIVNAEEYNIEVFYTSFFLTDSVVNNVMYVSSSTAVEQDSFAKTCAATFSGLRIAQPLQSLVGAPVITAVISK